MAAEDDARLRDLRVDTARPAPTSFSAEGVGGQRTRTDDLPEGGRHLFQSVPPLRHRDIVASRTVGRFILVARSRRHHVRVRTRQRHGLCILGLVPDVDGRITLPQNVLGRAVHRGPTDVHGLCGQFDGGLLRGVERTPAAGDQHAGDHTEYHRRRPGEHPRAGEPGTVRRRDCRGTSARVGRTLSTRRHPRVSLARSLIRVRLKPRRLPL